MNSTLSFLAYGGIGLLVILLIVFEVKDGQIGKGRTPQSNGYEYYTEDGDALRIQHVFGSLYKIYTNGSYCPVPTKTDRFGSYFTVRAGSASEAEQIVDGIYRRGC